MHGSKLITQIKTFSRVEQTRLLDFVQSPYFNKHEKVNQLMELIYGLYPDFDARVLAREQVHKQLFPNEKFDYQQLAHVMNYLQKLLDEFMAIEAFEGEDFLKNYYITRKLKSRTKGKLYEQKLRQLSKQIKKEKELNTQYFYNGMLVEDELDYYYLNRKKTAATNHLQNKSDNLDLFYIASKLEYWCDMLNRSNVLNIDYEYRLFDEVLNLIQSKPERYLSVPHIKIYYNVLQTLKDSEDETHYQALKKHLQQHDTAFSKEEAKTMYDYAQNYCIKRINLGDSKYLTELLTLYKVMLKKELIYEDGYFPPSDFKNIVTIACRLKEYNWTEDFIYRYKDLLEDKNREHVFQYNLAALFYEKGELEKALELLHQVEFTDAYFALGARSMLMKIYYELGETDPLFSHFDAFRTFLRRNKLVSKYQRQVHSNFIKFTKQAYNLKMKSEWERKKPLQQQASKLLNKIKSTDAITNRNWLEQKVQEVMPGG